MNAIATAGLLCRVAIVHLALVEPVDRPSAQARADDDATTDVHRRVDDAADHRQRADHSDRCCHTVRASLADINLATPETTFQDKPHFDFGIVPGDGVNLLWPEVIGSVRGCYFILTRQLLDAQTAKDYGAVNEILPADRLLTRAHEIAAQLAALPPLTGRYTRIALTQKLRRIVDDGAGYGLALEGISAADVARRAAPTTPHQDEE